MSEHHDDSIDERVLNFREHDYDPRWDYEIDYERLDHPLTQLGQQRMDELASRPDTPFERGHVFPAYLNRNPHHQNAVGVYANGTYNEPVILLDIGQHDNINVADPEDEIRRTVDHEVRHAMQDADSEGKDDWADEDDAESHRFGMAATRTKLLQEAERLPDNSDIIHEWPDGWSIRSPRSFLDHHREGVLMSNCYDSNHPQRHALWRAYQPDHYSSPPDGMSWNEFVEQEVHKAAPAETYSLRDPDNVPHLTVDADLIGTDDDAAYGRHNSDPKPEYVQRWKEFESLPGATTILPVDFNLPRLANATFPTEWNDRLSRIQAAMWQAVRRQR